MSALPKTPPPGRLRDERGFMLIEVLVSAIILITASLAIFSTLTQADTAAGNQQVRTEAANFAQSELERIRSLPVEDIMDFAKQGTATVKRNGITFNENVVAKWVSDGGDEPECTGQEGGLDYLRTTVTIGWVGQGNVRPVTLTSLYTPNAGAGGTTGSISVHIINADGGPDANITVNVKGQTVGGSYSGTTNVNGCVVFGFIPEDKYNLNFSRLGWVDQDSNPTVTDVVPVTAGETSKVSYNYDVAGWTKATFKTTYSGLSVLGLGVTPYTVNTYPQHMQIWHANQTAPGGFDIDFPNNLTGTTTANAYVGSSPQNVWDGTAANPKIGLYPFPSPYTIYAGNCPANAAPASANATFVNITRSVFQDAGTVTVPAIQFQVYSGSKASPQSLVGGARVSVDFGCGKWVRTTATALGTNTAGGQSPWGVGTLADPGFPYVASGSAVSPIRYCAYDPGANRLSQVTVSTLGNTNTTNGQLLKIYMNDTGSSAGTSSTTTYKQTATCM